MSYPKLNQQASIMSTADNTPIATESVATATVPADDSPNFEAFSSRLQQVATLTKELQTELKQLQRQFQKLARSKKAKKAPKADKAGASPSGFAKPTPLSAELCTFLSLSEGSELSRTSVTRLLNQYIKDNKLQNPDDKRTILPDDKLKVLLRLGGDEKVTYFNLQSFMKPHYVAKA
jgi:chromatin remodeling complex protein RSC6